MHGAHVVLGMAPIALCFQVADAQFGRESLMNAGYARRNFAGDKLKTTTRAFMIEKDAADAEHAVRFTVISGQIEASHFADSVRRARMKWSGFILWHFPHFAKHFRRTR